MTTMHADLSTKAALAARLAPGVFRLIVCTRREIILLLSLTERQLLIPTSCLAKPKSSMPSYDQSEVDILKSGSGSTSFRLLSSSKGLFCCR